MNKKKGKKVFKKLPRRASGSPASRKASKPATVSSNKSGITPLGDKVLVKPLSPEELGTTTSFGIIIPDTVNKEKSDRGTVVAVGPGKKDERGQRVAPEVAEGDRVLYTKPWNEPVKIGGEEYYLISESDILAILK